MKRITENGFEDIRYNLSISLNKDKTYKSLADFYGIPEEELRKQYNKWKFEGLTESSLWYWTKKVLFFSSIFFILFLIILHFLLPK
jgi:polyferredoxin